MGFVKRLSAGISLFGRTMKGLTRLDEKPKSA